MQLSAFQSLDKTDTISDPLCLTRECLRTYSCAHFWELHAARNCLNPDRLYRYARNFSLFNVTLVIFVIFKTLEKCDQGQLHSPVWERS